VVQDRGWLSCLLLSLRQQSGSPAGSKVYLLVIRPPSHCLIQNSRFSFWDKAKSVRSG
jgi:hypothetical protein